MIKSDILYYKKNIIISTKTSNGDTMAVNHFHPRYEIYYLLEGRRYYFINNATYEVFPSNVVLIPSNVLHKTIDSGHGYTRFLIEFDPSFLPFIEIQSLLDSVFSEHPIWNLPYTSLNQFNGLIQKIGHIAKQKEPFYESYLQAHLLELLLLLNQSMKESQLILPQSKAIHHRLSEIIQFIRLHYTEDLTLTSLAGVFNVSRNYLSRIFKKQTGFTVGEFINHTRMIEAQKLLAETDQPILEIAQSVGFNSISNFGRIFKEMSGVTPLKYRKLHKGLD